MGNRREEEGGGEGEGWGRLWNFKPNQKYNTNKQVRQLTGFYLLPSKSIPISDFLKKY